MQLGETVKTIILLFTLVGAGLAQDFEKTYLTNGNSNCRLWKISSDEFQMGLIFGYMDLWKFVPHVPEKVSSALTDATRAEIQKGITGVCSQPENGQMPVLFAAILFGAKVAGESPSDLENLGAQLRGASKEAK